MGYLEGWLSGGRVCSHFPSFPSWKRERAITASISEGFSALVVVANGIGIIRRSRSRN